jgi:hypothetical protein
MTLNIEVCGLETLTAAATQTLVFGFEAGTPGVMADGTRYNTITEATFGPYFTLTSVSGACPVTSYQILSDLGPTTWTDPQVTLPGSFGSYDFKIDKTIVSTAPLSVYIRAETDGLITADHEINYVVCPLTGGNTITADTGVTSASLDVNSAGTAANAPFNAWTFTEDIVGCGEFSHYAISGDAATLAYLQYPTPGLTLATDCTTINNCLNIRVLDTTAGVTLDFNIELHPVHGDPVSMAYQIVVDPCNTATITPSADPADLVIPRSATPMNMVQFAIDPDYLSLLISSDLSTPCPVDSIFMYDTAGVILVTPLADIMPPDPATA